MWNLLAGYAGMVSIGEQAFIGLGAYGVLLIAIGHVSPFAATPLAMVICGLLAVPVSFLVFRLRGGYFAASSSWPRPWAAVGRGLSSPSASCRSSRPRYSACNGRPR